MTTSDQFDFWRRAVAGEKVPTPATPQPGYYRIRAGDMGPWSRIGIWQNADGAVLAELDGQDTDPVKIWPQAVLNPTGYNDYQHHVDHRHYPDEPAPEQRNAPKDSPIEEIAEKDPVYFTISRKAQALFDEVNATIALGLAADADAAAALTRKLGEIAVEAEKAHEEEKRYWLEGGRKVDDRWSFARKLREAATYLKSKIITPILAEKRRRAEEEQRRAAEEARKAQEAATKRTRPGTAPPPPPPPPEPIAPISAGVGKRSLNLKEVEVATVTDAKAFAGWLVDQKNDDLGKLLEKLAARTFKGGLRDIPGVTITKQETVR